MVEEGDFLLMTYPTDGKGEVYRIDKATFEVTYQSETVGKAKSQIALTFIERLGGRRN